MKQKFVLQAIALGMLLPCFSQARAQTGPVPIEPVMVAVPAGAFQMGSPTLEWSQPMRTVSIKAFHLGKYEVTVKEFRRFVEATKFRTARFCRQMAGKRGFAELQGNWQENTLPSSEYHPVVCIGWNAMDAYVQWLAKETGKKYRLPTEAEWEYAYRAGSQRKYAHGNDEFEVCRHGNVADRSAEAALKRDYDGMESKNYVGVAPCDDKSDYASVVGMYQANPFGLHDMLGNVSEGLQDCFAEDYREEPIDGSARQHASCKERSKRGGSWHWPAPHAAARGAITVGEIGALEGFRVALDLDGKMTLGTSASASAFEAELSKVRATERERRAKLPELTAVGR